MPRCQKCQGLIIEEKTFAENQLITIKRCLNCAEYECPPENLELRNLNLLVLRTRKKAMGYTVYGVERKRAYSDTITKVIKGIVWKNS